MVTKSSHFPAAGHFEPLAAAAENLGVSAVAAVTSWLCCGADLPRVKLLTSSRHFCRTHMRSKQPLKYQH